MDIQQMRSKLLALLVLILGMTNLAIGAQFFGGNGLIHTNTALLVPKGGIDGNIYFRAFYTTVGTQYITNGTSAVTVNYGLLKQVELGFSQIMYQDLNATYRPGDEKTAVSLPGDTYFRIKYGSIRIGEKRLLSAIGNVRYRTAKFHDIHLEPYESGGIEAEFTLCASQYWNLLNPDEDKSAHANLGFIFHNDAEELFDSAMEITFLYGMFFPKGRASFGFETYGAVFIQRPDEFVLAREDWLYVTPVVKYHAFSSIAMTVGLDMLVLGRKETTTRGSLSSGDYPNYSDWRLSMRLNYTPYDIVNIAAYQRSSKRGKASAGKRKGGGGAYDRQSLFQWAIEGQSGEWGEYNVDLEKIRAGRAEVEEELIKLKQKLEEKEQEIEREKQKNKDK